MTRENISEPNDLPELTSAEELAELLDEDLGVIRVESEMPSDFSFPYDFSEHSYDMAYSLINDSSRKLNMILFYSLIVLAVAAEALLIIKFGTKVLVPKRIFSMFLIAGFVGGLLYLLKWAMTMDENCEIRLSKDGLKFSSAWRFELHNRFARTWEDVHSVHLEENINHQAWRVWFKPKDNPEQIKWTKENTLDTNLMVQFDFKSGGNASVFLNRLTKVQCRCLFLALENFVDQSKLSQEAVKLKHAIISDTTEETFTDIWMEDMEQRYAITNFVPLPVGHNLRARSYYIQSVLSTRGQTAVYLARNQDGESVIVKEMNAKIATSNDAIKKASEMFEREASILSRISHPDIASVLDHFFENNRVYLVLEYIPGITLRQLVKQKGARSCREVCQWIAKVLDTLHFLHNASPPIIHRDLSPDNIVLRKDGTPAIIDFGAANEFMKGVTGTMVGKQSYIAPEQFRGKAEPASDIYSLGATAYFLVTGADPVPLSESTIESDSIEDDEDRVFRDLVSELVAISTKYDTADRFKSADEVLGLFDRPDSFAEENRQ